MQVICKLKVTYLLYETPLVWYICVMETALFGVTQLKVNNWNRAALLGFLDYGWGVGNKRQR